MASSSIFHIFLPLFLFHLLISASSVPTRTEEQAGIRTPLIRVPAHKTLPKYASTNPSDVSPTKTRAVHGDVYVMSLFIGTPPTSINSAIMDTGSNLIWTKCKTSGSADSFDTSNSTTFVQGVSCDSSFDLSDNCKTIYYAGKKSVSVNLGRETLGIGINNEMLFKDVIFGCGKPNYNGFNFDGIVGMGPGKLSLVSQFEKRVFAYCLASRFAPKASSVFLTGSQASVHNTDVKTTPLHTDNSNYFITLEGISVGETKLAVTEKDFPARNGYAEGVVIDSGTAFTYFEKRIVDMISNEFFNQTKLEKYNGDDNPYYKGLKHCFNSSGDVRIPNLVFHFKGADWVMPRENYIYKKPNQNLACLAFIEDDDDKVSIFGNMQQQNMMLIYDLDKNSLSFKPANCNQF